jgi:hypothetical protein
MFFGSWNDYICTKPIEIVATCLLVDPLRFVATKTTFRRLLEFKVQIWIISFWHISCTSGLHTCEGEFAISHGTLNMEQWCLLNDVLPQVQREILGYNGIYLAWRVGTHPQGMEGRLKDQKHFCRRQSRQGMKSQGEGRVTYSNASLYSYTWHQTQCTFPPEAAFGL